MTAVAIVQRHPSDRRVALVLIGPELANAMASFPAARFDAGRRAYVVPVTELGPLAGHLERQGCTVVDDRQATPTPSRYVPDHVDAVPMPDEVRDWIPRMRDAAKALRAQGKAREREG